MNRKVECQDCDWTGLEDDTNEIKGFVERHQAGDVVAAGECPKCGALAMLVTDPKFIEVKGGLVTDTPEDCEVIDWDGLLDKDCDNEDTAETWSNLTLQAQAYIEKTYPDEYAEILRRLTDHQTVKTAEEIGNQHGYLCPKCGKGDQLDICATRSVEVRLCPDGTDGDVGDTEWEDSSSASCGCGWFGKVGDFRVIEVGESEEMSDSEIAERITELEKVIVVEDAKVLRQATEQSVLMDCTCGTCGKTFGDLYPSARCPFEYIHQEIAELKRLKGA